MRTATKETNPSRLRLLFSLLLLGATLHCAPPPPVPHAPDLARFEAGEIQFPGTSWAVVEAPTRWGWSEEHLARAREEFDRLESASVMVVHRGVLIASWGDVAARYNGQSMRKALLGALLGQEIVGGRLSLDATLTALGIDDSSHPLTEQERSARVVDLLQSRSGVYTSSLYEAGGWKRGKPDRGTHPPGEAWYYNNWGFNALGTLFTAISGETVHDAFARRVAEPIGMEDYRSQDVHYLSRSSFTERMQKNDSAHDAYVFMVSTRDMARFGLLWLAGGLWDGAQVVPREWVERSVTDTVPTLDFLGGDRFGYLWWVSPRNSALGEAIGWPSYKATGGRGHKVVVVPDLELVVVHRLATGGVGLASQLKRRFLGAPAVNESEFASLMASIVAAHPES